MRYGSLEYTYAAPIAEALAADGEFRKWTLQQTGFASDSDARLLNEEMRAARSKIAENWWRSHFTETCRCRGCHGQETDLLAVFEARTGKRFALHFEVKQPTDKFPSGKNQGQAYNVRARCWCRTPPANVIPHTEADTVLLCSKHRIKDYGKDVEPFGSIVTFEEVKTRFPKIGSRFGRFEPTSLD